MADNDIKTWTVEALVEEERTLRQAIERLSEQLANLHADVKELRYEALRRFHGVVVGDLIEEVGRDNTNCNGISRVARRGRVLGYVYNNTTVASQHNKPPALFVTEIYRNGNKGRRCCFFEWRKVAP